MALKADIETLRDLMEFSRESYEESRTEAELVQNYFHNRQYTDAEINVLKSRGQPLETFNVIKLFGRLLLGYYSTVVNTVVVNPVQYSDIDTASILNDLAKYTFEDNEFESEGDKIKLDGILTGLMCVYIDVQDTGEKDEFERPINRIDLNHVPSAEILIDPLSRLEDYSDARYIHRFKWVSKEQLENFFPKKKKEIQKLEDKQNWTDIEEADFERTFNASFTGIYKQHDFYLLVHSVITDSDGKSWSIFWSDETELEKEEITFKEVKFPYRVQKIHVSDRAEYYGIFREVLASQKSINQAVTKIQLLVNTQKAFVADGGVDDIAEFTNAFNRVNAVIPVKSLDKIRIENMTKDVIDLYTIIDKNFSRIQQVLGVNDSFLGMAFASDSGRKVKLQQNQTAMALRYVSVRMEQFYRLLGWDIVNLIKQYYTAYQVVRITDEMVINRWIEVNRPMTQWTGEMDENGQPVMEFVLEEVIDPASGEPLVDENGSLVMAPVPTRETDISFTRFDISIDSVSYNDQDEKNQLILETMLQGPIGQSLLSVNPGGFFAISALVVKSLKSKYSPQIVSILEQTAQGLLQSGNVAPEQGAQEQRGSTDIKLPQNTNEER